MAVEMKFLNNRTRYAEFFMDDDSTEISKLPNIDRAGQDNLSTVSGIAQGSKAMLTNSATTYYRLKGDGTWVKIIDEGGGGGGSDVTKEYVDEQLSYKVDKQNGKSLSTNDFTNTYRLKLDGIEEGAEVNVIAGITLNGSPLVPSNKIVALNTITKSVSDLENYYLKTETYTKSEVDALVNAISTLTLDVVDELPTEDISTTTIYLIKVEGSDNVYQQYVYINNAWAQLGTTEVDLSNYYTKTQIDALLLAKQDVLIFDDIPTVSSNNPVKSGGIYDALAAKQDVLTFDNVPTSGSNNPVKSGGIYSALENKQDTLTFDNTPTHGSDNVVTSGAIADAIANAETPIATETTAGKVKPDGSTITVDQDGTIHTVGGGGTQVQSDWNQTDDTAVDYIKNKPTIPEKIQYTTLPAASAELVGKVYQYTGATFGNLTHNYFYECVADTSTTPVAYSWVQTNVQAGGGSGSGSIVKGYRNPTDGKFYEESTYTTLITGDNNTIYIDIPTKYQYEYDTTSRTFIELGEKMPSVATEYDVGTVKPDNLTIFVDPTGTIRTKIWTGTQAEFDEQKYKIPPDTTIIIADSIIIPEGDTYVNGVKIVPLEFGTDEDVVAMLQGHYDGKINIYDYWNVGDKRTLHLNATPSSQGSLPPVYEVDIDMTLVNEGYGNNNVAYAVALTPKSGTLPLRGRIHNRMSGVESWNDLIIKDWFSNTLYAAIPETFKPIFKPFDYICATSYNGNTVTTYNDYFTFFAEKEVYGTQTYSNTAEANALQQIPWFADKSHRIFYDESSEPTLLVMPEPSAEYVNKTYRYIGATTEEFVHDARYICQEETEGVYKWYRSTLGSYWTRSIATTEDKIVTINRDEDAPRSINIFGGSWLYIPLGCI